MQASHVCMCESAVWNWAVVWDPGGKRLNFFSGKHCRVYGGGRKAHKHSAFPWMKRSGYESGFPSLRLRFWMCDAQPGAIRAGAEENQEKKWWKSWTDLLSGSAGWGRTGLTRKVSDLKWQIENWTEMMWLQGYRLYAWTPARLFHPLFIGFIVLYFLCTAQRK